MTTVIMLIASAGSAIWDWAIHHGLPVVVFLGGLSLAWWVYHRVQRTGGTR